MSSIAEPASIASKKPARSRRIALHGMMNMVLDGCSAQPEGSL